MTYQDGQRERAMWLRLQLAMDNLKRLGIKPTPRLVKAELDRMARQMARNGGT